MRWSIALCLFVLSPAAVRSQSIHHENGQRAWGGYDGATVYHANGERAWGGFSGASVYHFGGQRAWAGFRGATVYHANGERAWAGYAGASLYSANGQVLCGSADGIDLPIGEGIVLHLRLKPRYRVWLTVVCRDLEIDPEPGDPAEGCGCCEKCRDRPR